ncbi:MAG: hypothetical protein BGP05_07475 [Rhizobiales bacterium 62-47]|nr:HAD-IA family hydrolase [Hyphomicrobiales bacterium]OJY08665.1 MAG: hypothetical protein BGP05_07475 [Rhizobiales bacterium 62-47]
MVVSHGKCVGERFNVKTSGFAGGYVALRAFAALLFDVDGTLAETEELHRRAFNEAFAFFELPWIWDVALYRRLLRVTGGKERIKFFIREISGDDGSISNERIAEIHRFKTARYGALVETGACQLRPGVADLVLAASDRGQRLAIVTTASRHNVDALLEVTFGSAWQRYFPVVICGGDVRHKKPAAEAYLKALDYLELPPDRCLAIEDSRNGLLAAKGAGIPVLITRSHYFQDDDFSGALRIVGDLTELKDGLPACEQGGDTGSPSSNAFNVRAMRGDRDRARRSPAGNPARR